MIPLVLPGFVSGLAFLHKNSDVNHTRSACHEHVWCSEWRPVFRVGVGASISVLLLEARRRLSASFLTQLR